VVRLHADLTLGAEPAYRGVRRHKVSYEVRPDDGWDQLELMHVEGNTLIRKWYTWF
jgi:hypothetical protein